MSFNFIREKIHAKINYLRKFPNLQYFVQTQWYKLKYMYQIKLLKEKIC